MILSYQRMRSVLDEPALTLLLEYAVDRHTLILLCNQCGITYPGMRTKSVATDKLGADLSKRFFEQETAGDAVVRMLIKVCGDNLADIKKSTADTILSMPVPDGNGSFRQFCRTVLAVAMEGRDEMLAVTPALIDRATTYLNAMAEQRNRVAANRPDVSRARRDQGDGDLPGQAALESELRVARQEADRLSDANRSLDARAGQLREQLKTIQVEIDELRHQNHGLERQLADKTREAERLGDELRRLPVLTAQVNQLDRENRKLRYQIEKQPAHDAVPVNVQPLIHSIEKNVEEVRETVRTTSRAIESGYGDLRRTIDEMQREVHAIRIESQRERQPERLHRPARREQERVGIFVDVQNMFYAARQHDGRLDFEKLMQAVVGERRLIRAMAYVIQSPDVDQTGFVTMLQQRSYQVKRKDLRQRSDGSAKGDWDMGMAIDMIEMADKLDVVVLVSGDGDFVALVHLLKEMGPRVEVFSFPHNTARDLMEAADLYYPIDETLLMKMDRSAAVLSRESESAPAATE